MRERGPSDPQGSARLIGLLFLAGLLLSAAMCLRAQVGGDQLNLLARGWLLAEKGLLIPFGNPLSTGGNGPGPVTSWLVGLPLLVVRDHRAPVVLIWFTHLAAWLLLDRRLRNVLSPCERVAFTVVYWLNPWRLEASAFLWNPNYLFLVGALHFASSFDQRERASFAASFVHVLALGFGAQLHPAVLLLAITSLFLWRRGAVQVHWPGAVAGVAVVGATLVPWIAAARLEPGILAAEQGFPLRGIVLLQPFLKGLSYWLRLPSLALSGQRAIFDFSAWAGDLDRLLSATVTGFVAVAGGVTLLIALVANVQFFRQRFRLGWRAALAKSTRPAPREFVESYAFWAFVAAALTFAIAPTSPQSWQVVPLFHAAVLPVAFWAGRGASPFGRPAVLVAAAIVALAVNLALALGGPNFRCAGRGGVVFSLRSDSPMLDELGIQRTCRWPTRVDGAWWPDVLPEDGAAALPLGSGAGK